MPVPAYLNAIWRQLEPMGWRQPLYSCEECLCTRRLQCGEEMRHAPHIDAVTNRRQRTQSGRHGGEGKRAVRSIRAGEMQWAFSRVIAREKESLPLRIPAGQSKTTHQVINDIEAPSRPGMCQYLVVRSRLRKSKLARQIVVVVDPQVRDKFRGARRECGRWQSWRQTIVAGAKKQPLQPIAGSRPARATSRAAWINSFPEEADRSKTRGPRWRAFGSETGQASSYMRVPVKPRGEPAARKQRLRKFLVLPWVEINERTR